MARGANSAGTLDGYRKKIIITEHKVKNIYKKADFKNTTKSTIICKTVRGQNDPTLGAHVLKNTLVYKG